MAKASKTRYTILEKGFDLIYKQGYQTTSIDEIIATTAVTKGAFYYHFKTKEEMGIAVINEIIKPKMQHSFIEPLQKTSNPTETILEITKSLLLENEFLKLEYGCPAGNLTQEMTPWNSEFTKALKELIIEWQNTLEDCIQKGIDNGFIRNTVSPKQVGYFIISGYWGIRNFGKTLHSNDCYTSYLKELKLYLNNLKP